MNEQYNLYRKFLLNYLVDMMQERFPELTLKQMVELTVKILK